MADKKPAKKEYVWQHCVPRSYLRRFTDANGVLFVYDKVTDKVRADKPANVAAVKDFYTFPIEAFPEEKRGDVETKSMEFFFRDYIEPRFSAVVEEVLGLPEGAVVPPRLHEPLVFHLTYQLVRTEAYRLAVRQIMDKSAQSKAYAILREQFPDADESLFPMVEHPYHNVNLTHNRILLEESFIGPHMDVLMRYIWILGVSEPGLTLYTSDVPVSRSFIDKTGSRQGAKLTSEGVEYSLPLDSNHVLLLLERTYFGTRFDWPLLSEGTVIDLDRRFCDQLNQAQSANSLRCIFSAENDFAIAKALFRSQPHLRSLDRPRIVPREYDS